MKITKIVFPVAGPGTRGLNGISRPARTTGWVDKFRPCARAALAKA